LGERLLCKQEVVGSIPIASTTDPGDAWCRADIAIGPPLPEAAQLPPACSLTV
jgi:hypothetical protein